MNLKLYNKYVVALVFSLGFIYMGYSQDDDPPSPTNIPPPFGEPLPIDDYIPYLLIIAFFAGVYFYSKHDKNQATDS